MPQGPVNGQPFTATVSGVTNSGNLTFTCGTTTVSASAIRATGNPGEYEIDFPGSSIFCPGPLKIKEKVGNSSVERASFTVSGC